MQCASPILEAAESLFWPKPAPQEAAPAPNLAVLLSERDADVPTVRKALATGARVGKGAKRASFGVQTDEARASRNATPRPEQASLLHIPVFLRR